MSEYSVVAADKIPAHSIQVDVVLMARDRSISVLYLENCPQAYLHLISNLSSEKALKFTVRSVLL